MPSARRALQSVDVFIVDADPGQRRALSGLISQRTLGRFLPRPSADAAEALAAGRGGNGAIVIADLDTVGPDSFSALTRRPAPVIATSASSSLNVAVAAVRAGAVDFLAKPIGAKALIERLEAALTARESHAFPPPQTPTAVPLEGAGFAGFIGDSPAMHDVYAQIRRMAPSRAPVFITGESGTGKEVTAEAIHSTASGDDRPFVALNCSAIPKELMESEIFGHVRGAFTGASDNRTGAAELANGGTLFLDELAEMDLGLQAKLLRFVQTGSLRPVGGTDLRKVDVRIVSATNRDPFAEVAAGRFRADLFYRLHVLPIHLPPLRDRREDIMPLAEAFLARYAAEEKRTIRGFDTSAVDCLEAYGWPGNVRQLQNVIRRIVVLHERPMICAAMLPPEIAVPGNAAEPSPGQSAAGTQRAIRPFRDQERAIIESALAAFDGNIARAAAALEISPSTIYRKRQEWLRGIG